MLGLAATAVVSQAPMAQGAQARHDSGLGMKMWWGTYKRTKAQQWVCCFPLLETSRHDRLH